VSLSIELVLLTISCSGLVIFKIAFLYGILHGDSSSPSSSFIEAILTIFSGVKVFLKSGRCEYSPFWDLFFIGAEFDLGAWTFFDFSMNSSTQSASIVVLLGLMR